LLAPVRRRGFFFAFRARRAGLGPTGDIELEPTGEIGLGPDDDPPRPAKFTMLVFGRAKIGLYTFRIYTFRIWVFAESHCNRNTDPYDKTSPENRVTSHRKTESHAASAQECRCQDAGIPHRERGREADRRMRGQPATASRPDHDPNCLP